jgi:membrane fusion protein (multidrug efflux system)
MKWPAGAGEAATVTGLYLLGAPMVSRETEATVRVEKAPMKIKMTCTAATGRTFAAAVLLATLGACSGTEEEVRSGPDPRDRAVTVLTEYVEIQPIADSIEALGTARANESVTITANLTETVRKVHFEDGQQVQAGDVLVELTSEEEAALLQEAQANLRDAERQLQRLQDLADQGLAAASELDTAGANRNAAEARLETVLARIQDRLVRAPFTGVLGFREVSTGTLVSPGTAITTLDDVSRIKLDFSVPELFLDVIRTDDPVVASRSGADGRQYRGVVGTIGTRVDPITRSVVVRAILDNPDGSLRPGMLLTVSAKSNQREAIVVPEAAVFQVADAAYVYTVDADDTARRRDVTLGARQPGIVEILAGLRAGEEIVVEGTIRLTEGAPIKRKIKLNLAGEADVAAVGGSASAGGA